MATIDQLPDLLAVDHVVIGLALAGLERRWRMASLAVDAGAEPAGIDDDTLGWWRAAYRTYIAGPSDLNPVRRLELAAADPDPIDDRTRRSPAA